MSEKVIHTPGKEATRRKKVGIEAMVNAVRENPMTKKAVLLRSGYKKDTADTGATIVLAQKEATAATAKSEVSIKDALAVQGLDVFAVADRIKALTDHEDYRAVSNGVDFALKVGVGGGYAPTRSQNIDVKVAGDVREFAKFRALSDEYDARLALEALREEDENNG